MRIPLPDGDLLSARLHQGEAGGVAVYFFHGLAGSIESDYMGRMRWLAEKRGWQALAVNHRGCGEGQGLASRPYHSGRGEDISAAIAWGRQNLDAAHHVAVGFSLSGNALLLLQAGVRGDCPPDLGIAVNAPIDLAKSAKNISSGRNLLYDQRFVRRCKRQVKAMVQAGRSAQVAFPWFLTLRGFDAVYTAPAGGFASREDYYAICSARQHLHRIQQPTLILTSKDDPMVDYQDYESADISPQTLLHLENTGGHMGYLHHLPTPLGTRRWLDYALDRYISTWCAQSSHPAKGSRTHEEPLKKI